MAERLRLYSGVTELSYTEAWIEKTNDILTNTGYAEIVAESTVSPFSTITFKKDDGATTIFSPRVTTISKVDMWRCNLVVKAAELNTKHINKTYAAGTAPEAIVQDIIDNYTSTLTYASSTVSGITLTQEYIAKDYLINILKDMQEVLNWQFRFDASDNVYFEPPGTIDNGVILTEGTDGQIQAYITDDLPIVNHVKVIGGFEEFQTTEPKTGTNTVFSFDRKPQRNVRVTVGGTEIAPTNYYVSAENQTITFTSAKTDPILEYTYVEPVNVDRQDDTSISVHGEKYVELQAPWLNHLTDAIQYSKEYIAAYKDTFITCKFILPGMRLSIDAGETVRVISTRRNLDKFLVVSKIRYDAGSGTTILEIGTRTSVAGDWQRGIQDRIKYLERRNINTDLVAVSRSITSNLNVGLSIERVWQQASPQDSGLYAHTTLGAMRSGKDIEFDCSLNGKYGLWLGTNTTTGGQYSQSGWRLGTASLNGVNHFCFRNESLLYVSNTANSIFLAFKTSNVTPASSLNLYAERNSASNNAQFLIQLNSTSQIRVFIANNAGTTRLATNSTTTITANTWHYLLWTDNNGTASLYIDGVLDATNFNYTRTGTFDMNRTAVGASYGLSTTGFWSGQIDEVRLYNKVLSSVERNAISNKYQSMDGLLVYWSMDNPHYGDRHSSRVDIV